MNYRSFKFGAAAIFQIVVSAVSVGVLLASCGGGGGHNAGDTNLAAPIPTIPDPVNGPDSFLIFPNPQSGVAPINSQTYADVYYATIDPNSDKDTLAKWKTANGFGSGTGTEVHAIFGDVRDLGYGRDMHGRMNPDGTLAFFVDNYEVWPAADYFYNSMNLEAAIAGDKRWYVGTNGIEISPGPECTPALLNTPKCDHFAKYFTFNPVTGARSTAINIDGRGLKSMPGVCIECHGARGDSLLPASIDATNGQPKPIQFAIVGNPASGVRGDVQGKLHFFEPDSFDFSTLPGYTRADQEAAIKTLNKFVLCSYPLPYTASGVPIAFAEDECRTVGRAAKVARRDEWQGGAADVIKAAYNGGVLPVPGSGVIDGMPNPVYVDDYVPPNWIDTGHTDLYVNVIKPECRVCHLLRGASVQSDIDFSTFTGFQSFADRVKEHIIDKGNMPLDRILNVRFWNTPSMYNSIAQFLQASNPVGPAASDVTYTVTDNIGALLRPGRPIAVPGPDRAVAPTSGVQPAATLSAAGSWFADTFTWTIVSMPAGGDGNLNGSQSSSGLTTTFNATVAGSYQIKLVVSKGGLQPDSKLLTIEVVNPWPLSIASLNTPASSVSYPVPADIRFSHIKEVFQEKNACADSCHNPTDSKPPPILYKDIDRNGDGVVQSGVNEADDVAFYNQVLGRINFGDISSSLLLRHPIGYNHNGGIRPGFGAPSSVLVKGVPVSGVPADQLTPGDHRRSYYDMFLNWILNGAPY